MTMNLEPNLSFRIPTNTPYHFFVVGAGGTGGHLLPNLIRQIGLRNEEREQRGVSPHTITVVDADFVEEKNLRRQQFTSNDIGKNKAAVMARRYGKAFNVPVAHIEKYITSPTEMLQMLADSIRVQRGRVLLRGNGPLMSDVQALRRESFMHIVNDFTVVVIDATDNNKTRLILETAVDAWRGDAVILSSGNEEKAGQVVFTGHQTYMNLLNTVSIPALSGLFPESRLLTTPSFFDLFPTAPIEKLPTEISCAEATVSAPQAMIANITAANILFNFANKLLAYEPIRHFLVFFDTDGLGQKSYRFTESDLKKALSMTPNNAAITRYLYNGSLEAGIDVVNKPTWEDALKLAEEERAAKEAELAAVMAGVRS